MKTALPMLSELKMQAVFTRKNKGLSRLYDRKFTPSCTTSRDGINRPDKNATNHIARSDICLPNSARQIFSRRSPRGSLRFRNADEFSEFNRNTLPFEFTIPSAPLDPSVPQPGPYLFHGTGLPNPKYQHFSPATLQFMPAETLIASSERNSFFSEEVSRESIQEKS